MFTLEDREICKNCEYKEICAGELEYRYKNYPMEFWEISNHHLNDEIEIVKE